MGGIRQYRQAVEIALALLVTIGALMAPAGAVADPADDRWSNRFTLRGVEGEPKAFLAEGEDIYIAGRFLTAGDEVANNIIRFDRNAAGFGLMWNRLGDGCNGDVRGLTLFDGDLIACGAFTTAGGVAANHVARWDGTQWHAMGDGVPNAGEATVVYDGDLYCGAYRWNGATWDNVFQVDSTVRCFTEWDGSLVVGGSFTTAGGQDADHVFVWDGESIQPVLEGVGSRVQDLAVYQGDLIAFTPYSSPVLRWSGSTWESLGTPPSSGYPFYDDIIVHDGELILSSWWSWLVSGTWGGTLHRWDVTGWQTIEGADWTRYGVMYSLDGDILLGGGFAYFGETPAANIGLYRGNGLFEPLTPYGWGCGAVGGRAAVRSFAATPNGIAVAGEVRTFGAERSFGAAIWDGTTWHPRGLTGGLDYMGQIATHPDWGILFGIASATEDYVAWQFCYWSGSSWFPSGQVVACPEIDDLVLWSDRVLGAGEDGIYEFVDPEYPPTIFAETGGGGASCFTMWNGNLVVAGHFTAIDGVSAPSIAIYDGNAWSWPGSGIDGYIYDIEPFGNLLAVGGSFDEAGGIAASNIALTDGTSWYALGEGCASSVRAMTVHDGVLYVGGSFAHAGSHPANHVACWDGMRWYPLGSGIDRTVVDMIVFDDHIYCGGDFVIAGGKPSAGIAAWDPEGYLTSVVADERPAHSTVLMTAPNPFNPTVEIAFDLVRDETIRVAVYDLAGAQVAVVANGFRGAGRHVVTWQGRDASGRAVPSGTYVVRLTADSGVQTSKISLVR